MDTIPEDYHGNIADSLNKLKQQPAEEEKKKTEALANAKPKLIFLQEAGRALLPPTVCGLAAKWRSKDCDLEVVIRNGEFIAKGEYDREEGGLGSVLGLKASYHYTVEFWGKVCGNFVEGFIKRGNNRPKGLLNLGEGEIKTIMIISPDKHLIRVMENPAASKPSFYELTALEPLSF